MAQSKTHFWCYFWTNSIKTEVILVFFHDFFFFFFLNFLQLWGPLCRRFLCLGCPPHGPCFHVAMTPFHPLGFSLSIISSERWQGTLNKKPSFVPVILSLSILFISYITLITACNFALFYLLSCLRSGSSSPKPCLLSSRPLLAPRSLNKN